MRFLTPEWIERMSELASSTPPATGGRGSGAPTLRVVVTGTPDGDVAYSLRLGGGRLDVVPEVAADAEVQITLGYDTATRISQGRLTPSAAFATGLIRFGGRVGLLVEHREAATRLGDVFASLRSQTSY